MKTRIVIFFMLIILHLTLFSKYAIAENCLKAVPIFTGEIAKCDGLLYSEDLASEHLSLRVKVNELSQKLAVIKDNCKKQIAVCSNNLIKADQKIFKISNPPFYKTQMFNFFSGAIVSFVFLSTISLVLH